LSWPNPISCSESPAQRVRASRLVISHCLTAPHSSNHKDSQIALTHIREYIKNAICTAFFTKAKGTLPPEKRHFLCLLKTWGALAPLPPPPPPSGSYAPEYSVCNTTTSKCTRL
jgi:hypothetical protein